MEEIILKKIKRCKNKIDDFEIIFEKDKNRYLILDNYLVEAFYVVIKKGKPIVIDIPSKESYYKKTVKKLLEENGILKKEDKNELLDNAKKRVGIK